jgi:tetratricopeptide (TPR) repeat protein
MIGVSILCLLAAQAAAADIEIKSRTEDGATISGEHKFRVTAVSDSLVTQVEFYVDDELRDTDSSTPYEFAIDTLAEDDGPLSVTFSVYAEDGSSGEKTLNLTVDNGVALGLKHHVDKGYELMADSAWDDAIAAGRVALKIDSNSVDALLLMARAHYGKKVFDLAQKYAEDALENSPGDKNCLELLTGIGIEVAFDPFVGGSDRDEAIELISSSLQQAAKARAAAVDQQIDALGPVTDENRVSNATVLINAGRYSEAIRSLKTVFESGRGPSDAVSLQIYAEMRAGRMNDAMQTYRLYKKFGELDAFGYALEAIILEWAGQEDASRDAEQEAILNDPFGLTVRTSQVYLAFMRGDNSTFAQLVNDLVREDSGLPIVNYYLSSIQHKINRYNESQESIKKAMIANPSLYDAYIERANQVLIFSYSNKFESSDERARQEAIAQAFFDAALAIKPESHTAMTGIALLKLYSDDAEGAVPMAAAAAKAAPGYAAAHYVHAAALMAQRLRQQASAAMDMARKTDNDHLGGRNIPTNRQALLYYLSRGRLPLLALPEPN